MLRNRWGHDLRTVSVHREATGREDQTLRRASASTGVMIESGNFLTLAKTWRFARACLGRHCLSCSHLYQAFVISVFTHRKIERSSKGTSRAAWRGCVGEPKAKPPIVHALKGIRVKTLLNNPIKTTGVVCPKIANLDMKIVGFTQPFYIGLDSSRRNRKPSADILTLFGQ